jgi:hypothetical protein
MLSQPQVRRDYPKVLAYIHEHRGGVRRSRTTNDRLTRTRWWGPWSRASGSFPCPSAPPFSVTRDPFDGDRQCARRADRHDQTGGGFVHVRRAWLSPRAIRSPARRFIRSLTALGFKEQGFFRLPLRPRQTGHGSLHHRKQHVPLTHILMASPLPKPKPSPNKFGLESIPESVQRLNQLLAKRDASTDDFAKLISQDKESLRPGAARGQSARGIRGGLRHHHRRRGVATHRHELRPAARHERSAHPRVSQAPSPRC